MPSSVCCCADTEPPTFEYFFHVNLIVRFKAEVYESGITCPEYNRYVYRAREYIVEAAECGPQTETCTLPLRLRVTSIVPTVPGFCNLTAIGTLHLVDPTECAGNCDPVSPPRQYVDSSTQTCHCLNFSINCTLDDFVESDLPLCTGVNVCTEDIHCWNSGLPEACFPGTITITVYCPGVPNPTLFPGTYDVNGVLIPSWYLNAPSTVSCQLTKAEWRVDGENITDTPELFHGCNNGAMPVKINQTYIHPEEAITIQMIRFSIFQPELWYSAEQLYNTSRIDPGCPRDQLCDLGPPFVNCDCYPPPGSYDPNAIVDVCTQICGNDNPNCHLPNNYNDELVNKIDLFFITP